MGWEEDPVQEGEVSPDTAEFRANKEGRWIQGTMKTKRFVYFTAGEGPPVKKLMLQKNSKTIWEGLDKFEEAQLEETGGESSEQMNVDMDEDFEKLVDPVNDETNAAQPT